jgi:hypothetical protein
VKSGRLVLRIACGLRKRPKVFCIGYNKTGTTSLARALTDLGYRLGDQATAELLIHDYARRNFRPIVEFCRTAEAFQDIPFSLPYTYQVLDYAFPDSRFILSIRDDEDEWYRSRVRFTQKRLGLDGRITREDLLNDPYRYRGFLYEVNRIIHDPPDDDPYNETVLKDSYLRHNRDVFQYFRLRDDLLVVNLKEPDSYQRLCDFLGVEPLYQDFPWLNRSDGD